MIHKSLLSAAALFVLGATAARGEDWTPLFDGKTLNGWRGDPAVWSVQDGAITGVNSAEHPVKHNVFLASEQSFGDFEIKFKYRIVGGNSGLQYRSRLVDDAKYVVHGYQADLEAGKNHSGIVYEEGGRGILATRGKKVEVTATGERKELANIGDPAAIQANIRHEDWNEYHVTAKGNHLVHRINGMVTAELIDNQEAKRAMSGILAFQVHQGPPMKVQFKDIVIRKL